MNKYVIEITETLQKQIEIEAETATDAIAKIKQQYNACELVLSAEDHVETKIDVVKRVEEIERKKTKLNFKSQER